MKLGSIEPQEPFSGVTLPMQNRKDPERVKRSIDTSRKKYASVYVRPKKTAGKKNIVMDKTKEKDTKGKKKKDVGMLSD